MNEEALEKLGKEISRVNEAIYGIIEPWSYYPKKDVEKYKYYIKDIHFEGDGRQGFIYATLYEKEGGIAISADLPYILNKFGGSSRLVRNYKYYVCACIYFQQLMIEWWKGRRVGLSHTQK